MERTSRGKFEGGDAAWEEERLKSYSTSEVRLIEIQENLCADIKDGINQCHFLAEENEQLLEEWWFNKQMEEPDLFKFLCINTLKHCCPENHYGMECKACPGFPDNVCNKNGKCKLILIAERPRSMVLELGKVMEHAYVNQATLGIFVTSVLQITMNHIEININFCVLSAIYLVMEDATKEVLKEVALRVSHSSLMSSDRMKPGDWAVVLLASKDDLKVLVVGTSLDGYRIVRIFVACVKKMNVQFIRCLREPVTSEEHSGRFQHRNMLSSLLTPLPHSSPSFEIRSLYPRDQALVLYIAIIVTVTDSCSDYFASAVSVPTSLTGMWKEGVGATVANSQVATSLPVSAFGTGRVILETWTREPSINVINHVLNAKVMARICVKTVLKDTFVKTICVSLLSKHTNWIQIAGVILALPLGVSSHQGPFSPTPSMWRVGTHKLSHLAKRLQGESDPTYVHSMWWVGTHKLSHLAKRLQGEIDPPYLHSMWRVRTHKLSHLTKCLQGESDPPYLHSMWRVGTHKLSHLAKRLQGESDPPYLHSMWRIGTHKLSHLVKRLQGESDPPYLHSMWRVGTHKLSRLAKRLQGESEPPDTGCESGIQEKLVANCGCLVKPLLSVHMHSAYPWQTIDHRAMPVISLGRTSVMSFLDDLWTVNGLQCRAEDDQPITHYEDDEDEVFLGFDNTVEAYVPPPDGSGEDGDISSTPDDTAPDIDMRLAIKCIECGSENNPNCGRIFSGDMEEDLKECDPDINSCLTLVEACERRQGTNDEVAPHQRENTSAIPDGDYQPCTSTPPIR
uniref:Uncharacterized protein n=1 Tax=Timema douglasi TaxID=61478 RepID=A0A7R8VQ96_TIMDO|nr:unnamed protein product [Timema douglasi]